jgi:hypothetical protein
MPQLARPFETTRQRGMLSTRSNGMVSSRKDTCPALPGDVAFAAPRGFELEQINHDIAVPLQRAGQPQGP